MKIKVTYQPEEDQEAVAVLAALLALLPGAKVRRDKSQAPKLCVYVTIKGPQTVAVLRKTLDKTAPRAYDETKE